MTAPPTLHGLLLVHAEVPAVTAWAARGLVPVRLEPVGAWTAVTPADGLARSAPPYEDAVAALAARPLGPRMRPSIGFFVTGDVAVLTARDRGWRALQRWLLWSSRTGVSGSADLPVLTADDLADVVGLRGPLDGLSTALGARPTAALDWLVGVHVALGLPGSSLLRVGASSRSTLVEPSRRSVAQFDHLAADERAHADELAGEER